MRKAKTLVLCPPAKTRMHFNDIIAEMRVGDGMALKFFLKLNFFFLILLRGIAKSVVSGELDVETNPVSNPSQSLHYLYHHRILPTNPTNSEQARILVFQFNSIAEGLNLKYQTNT